MSDGYPAMTARGGLLAVAGYQNKDEATMPSNRKRVLGGLGSAGVGGLVGSGLSEHVEHFT